MKNKNKSFICMLLVCALVVTMFPISAMAAKRKVVPSKVQLTKISAPAYNQINIKWKKASNATHYKIYYKKAKAKKWTSVATVKGNRRSYTHTSSKKRAIKPGQKYTYTVKAYNSKSKRNGKYDSKGKTTYTKPQKVKMRYAKLASNKKSVTVKWYQPKGSTHVRVYRKVAGDSWKRLATLKAKTTTYVDKKPIRGKSYYMVRSYYSPTKIYGSYSSSKLVNMRHNHVYGSWVIKKKVTCTSDGYDVRKCKYCDHTQRRDIPKMGHNMQAEYVKIVYWQCNNCHAHFGNEDDIATHVLTVCGCGYTVVEKNDTIVKKYKCTQCNLTKPGDVLTPCEHKISDWYIVSNPTCVIDGEKARFCYRCNKKESIVLPNLEGKHEYERVAYNPSTGIYTYKCKYCEDSYFSKV